MPKRKKDEELPWQMSYQDIADKIDNEGFHYFFTKYVSIDDLPEGLQAEARCFKDASDSLEAELEALFELHGVEREF